MGDTTFFCGVHINDTGDEPGGLVPCSRGTMWMEATILMNKNTLTVEEHINRLMQIPHELMRATVVQLVVQLDVYVYCTVHICCHRVTTYNNISYSSSA